MCETLKLLAGGWNRGRDGDGCQYRDTNPSTGNLERQVRAGKTRWSTPSAPRTSACLKPESVLSTSIFLLSSCVQHDPDMNTLPPLSETCSSSSSGAPHTWCWLNLCFSDEPVKVNKRHVCPHNYLSQVSVFMLQPMKKEGCSLTNANVRKTFPGKASSGGLVCRTTSKHFDFIH